MTIKAGIVVAMERLEITAPSSFEAGKTVYIRVTVYNDAPAMSTFWIALTANGSYLLDEVILDLDGYGSKSYDIDFPMPSVDVLLIADVDLYTGDEEVPWLDYDHVEKTIESTTPTPTTEWTKLSQQSGVIEVTSEVTPIPTVWTKLGQSVSTFGSGFSIPPDYKLVLSTVYPDGKAYTGPAERCFATFSFLPANWPGSTWFIDHLLEKLIADKLTEAGAKPLTLKLYGSGFDYMVVIEAAKPAVQSAMPVIQIGWSIIILAALALAALIVIFFTIKKTEDFIYKSPAAAIASGLIILGIAGVAVLGFAILKGSSVKGAITGKR